MKILIATNNINKVKEIREILKGSSIDVFSMDEAGIDADIEENGSTFSENALIKARELFRISGGPTLADDSGLVVEALGGAPGVYSARYSGIEGSNKDDANIIKLLSDMKDIKNRKAYFACAIVFIDPSGNEHVVEGQCHGSIADTKKGINGFGYDSIFIVDGADGKTMAEISPEIKNNISHRGNALKKIKKVLEQI